MKLSQSGITLPSGVPLLPPARLADLHDDSQRTNAVDLIRQALKAELASRPKPSFVLVLLENRDNYIYPGIKAFHTPFVYLMSADIIAMNSALVTSSWVSTQFTCSSKRLS
jgi:hypothetical protein